MWISLDMPNTTWDIMTEYTLNDRDMIIGTQLKDIG